MEVGDTILKESNAQLRVAVGNKDFKEVSVAQAMIEAAEKKISSANKAMQQQGSNSSLFQNESRPL